MRNTVRHPAPAEERPEQQNINTIARLEHETLHTRSFANRISDTITRFSGSMVFILLHLLWFAAWILENEGVIPGTAPFDPFPFNFLTLIVSLEAIFLSTFVLMSQNHMSQQADKRAHLDLQINILAEQESTLTLRLVQLICTRLGIEAEAPNEKIQQLSHKTDVHALLTELEKRLPS
jgi:uncharacterized membrane protein